MVTPIVGKADPAETLVPLDPVKNDWAKVTDLVEVVEAIAVFTVSTLLSSSAV